MNYRILSQLCLGAALLLPFAAAPVNGAEATQPLTLKQAVERALQNNLNLKLTLEDTEIAGGNVDIAQSRFDKNITAQAGYESQEATQLMIGGAEQEDTGNFNLNLAKRFTTGTEFQFGWQNNSYDSDSTAMILNPVYTSGLNMGLAQPLLRGWGSDIQTAAVQAAEKNYDASSYQVDSTAADLAAEVKTGYWNLVFAWQDISVKKLSLELAQKLLGETEAKISAGKLAQVEVYQPQSEVARREEDLIGAERAIGTAEDNLKLLMNSGDWLIQYEPTDSPLTTPVTLEPFSVLNNALENRPDLKATELAIQAARLDEMIAEDNLRPELNLSGGLAYGGTDDGYSEAISASIDDPDLGWQVGLNFTHSLDNSMARGRLRQAKANHSKARTNLQLLKLQITKSVRTTVRDVELAIKAMEATRKTSLATKKRLEAEEAKFEAGRSTTLDVLAAQEAYSQALSQENRTAIVYVQSLAELDRIQGLISLPE
ncbi:TolC family protein [Desulfopila sp. IMCC35008]|uniref:TolC family protein n=1 Tax=Desulfopila sp. IMCC35008 TaxID=2653858 RepID=UPI0013D19D2C|nr:TolC family protein [Desulfopila sp. IMCC35008]